ncbi:MAG: CTP synthase [Acholeplasmatales bacterium]|nr:CTP synthase [Acholeplasmatales bacterium]
MKTKFIFVTGGVVSSLGKGIAASSIGRILKNRGLKIFMQKFDPYINMDPGTMSPYQHGEVFVTDDGAETDLDLGHYERFIDESLSKNSNITTGKIYSNVIQKERRGEYNGGTVQVIPHITNEIKDKLKKAAIESNADIVITEIGGTVGDIESLPFLEAIRQARRDFGYENTLYIHNTLVPYLKAADELKTKPTQHSVMELRKIGIQPDIIILRTEVPLSESQKDKIALFCDVNKENVIEALDQKIIYNVAKSLHEQNIDDIILKHFKIDAKEADMSEWYHLIERIESLNGDIRIGLVGKYVNLHDAYLSVAEALKAAGYYFYKRILIDYIDSSLIDKSNVEEKLSNLDGIIIPGGFGDRGIDGMLIAIEYARINKIPLFGICLGMQLICIEYARNEIGYKDANSGEFDKETKHNIIDYLENQYDGINIGGTLRLGLYDCHIEDMESKTYKAYQKLDIKERHRHRYEVNNKFLEIFDKDLKITGRNLKSNLVEIVELKNHPWFIGCQFHPEFLSRPERCHPLFKDFIEAAMHYKK